jgi:hypothetical protein
VIIGVICGLVAVPLCEASWHAIVTAGEYFRGTIGLLVGLPIGVAGLTFHWWKTKFDRFGSTIVYWWPIAIVLSFVYVAGPEIYRSATTTVDSPETTIAMSTVKDDAPTEIPTSLRLQFDTNGAARQIDKQNIKDWRSINSDEAILSSGYAPSCGDEYIRKPSGMPAGQNYTEPSFCLVKTKTRIVVLSYEKPILLKYVSLNAHGATLPNWDNVGSTGTFAVIWIHGELKNMILDITMVK